MAKSVLESKGKLIVITGPMFSGKTEELLRQLHLAQYAQKKTIFFTSSEETYDLNKSSNNLQPSNEIVANPISKSNQIYKYLKNKTEAKTIFIDKLHFFDKKVVEILPKLAKKGYRVVAAGLDQDFKGEAFKQVAVLLALADKVIKLTSICRVCHRKATMTQRTLGLAFTTDPIVLIGNKDIYEARCRSCHVVGEQSTAVGEKSDWS